MTEKGNIVLFAAGLVFGVVVGAIVVVFAYRDPFLVGRAALKVGVAKYEADESTGETRIVIVMPDGTRRSVEEVLKP